MSNDSIMRVAKAIREENAQISIEDATAFAEYMVKCANAGIDGYRQGFTKGLLCFIGIGVGCGVAVCAGIDLAKGWIQEKKQKKNVKKTTE